MIRARKIDGKESDYADRVNRAINLVLQNLAEPLPLETVAKVACFSPFHFHRVFRALVGESLNEFVKRVRLERALALMAQAGWPARRPRSLTEIALACGFGSSANFARCFKQRHGVAPSRFDVAAFRGQQRKRWESTIADPGSRNLLPGLKPGANPDGFRATLRRLPPRHVAYLRVMAPFREGVVFEAAQRLLRWAEGRGLADGQWLGYMWDDPDISAPEQCRYDVGLVVPTDASSGGGASFTQFPAMTVAEVEIRGGIDLEVRALDWLYGSWLPTSGFVPADQPSFEAWIGRPFARGTEYFELRAQLPVTREGR